MGSLFLLSSCCEQAAAGMLRAFPVHFVLLQSNSTQFKVHDSRAATGNCMKCDISPKTSHQSVILHSLRFIIAAGLDGIFAYCLQSGALLWDYCDTIGDNTDVMSATDVATDGNNKIFVCDDGNGCVHVFSPDGAYVGDLIRKEERGLGLPFKISWNERNKSLLVAHKRDEIVHVSSVKISL